MSKKSVFGLAAVVIAIIASHYLLNPTIETPPPASHLRDSSVNAFPNKSTERKVATAESSSKTDGDSMDSKESSPQSVWKLDSSNFEHRVSNCFQGEPCELTEDPLALYRFYKKNGNRRASDLLISYLRKNLKDPEFAGHYKDALKTMIDDFYPREEHQFQEAAYYNYLGELDKSLSLYLDLESKASADPSLKRPPKLNIANTYYDLGKLREALPYYQAALGRILASGYSQDDTVRFVERRIEEIKTKLGS